MGVNAGRRLLCVLLTITFASWHAAAQGLPLVRGDVVLADSTTRAAGVIVVILDARNTTVVSGLTSDVGQFALRPAAPGRYSARVLRIGFRPTIVAPFEVRPDAPTVLHIVLGAEAVRLTEVRVRSDDVCRIRADSGKLVAQVWEQARQALTSTRLSAGDATVHVTAIMFDRMLDSTARTVLRGTTTAGSGLTTRAFVSVPSESLNTLGYARRSGDDMEYFGPDAEALISDAFASTHCFRILPSTPEWPRSVGVAFRPARNRNNVVDIAGTFWMDRETAELQALEYTFTNVPRAVAEPGAGGRVEFTRLANGAWIVNRWSMRVETATARRESEPQRRELLRSPEVQRVFDRFVSVFGGEVTTARRGDRELYADNGATFDALVTTSDGSPLRADSVEMELEGPGYFTTGDAAGRLHLAHLRPGSYNAVVTTRDMRDAALPAVRRRVSVREGAAQVDTLALPSGDELVAGMCGARSAQRHEAFVAGVLRDTAGRPLERDTVRLYWRGGSASAAQFAQLGPEGSFTAVTDFLGHWFACGLPRNVTVGMRPAGFPASAALITARIPANMSFAVARVVGVRRKER